MSFAWAAYLTLAEALFRERVTFADKEACCRAAISRAYYAAFGAARNHARDSEGLTLSHTASDHQSVPRHYRQGSNLHRRAINAHLRRLRDERNRADYNDPNIQQVDDVARNALNRARQVFTLLDQLRP